MKTKQQLYQTYLDALTAFCVEQAKPQGQRNVETLLTLSKAFSDAVEQYEVYADTLLAWESDYQDALWQARMNRVTSKD